MGLDFSQRRIRLASLIPFIHKAANILIVLALLPHLLHCGSTPVRSSLIHPQLSIAKNYLLKQNKNLKMVSIISITPEIYHHYAGK